MKNNRDHKIEEVTFARDLGLFEATMIGVGAMIGAGIFVLTGIAAGEAGPASILAFSLNGIVTLLTAFAYAELASAIPRAGGGYAFVRMAFPGGVGFVAGWMLWFAYVVACSLYALGFASYFLEFFAKYIPEVTHGLVRAAGEHSVLLLVTLLVGIAFIWLNARGAAVTGKAENALTISKLVVLAVFILFGLRKILDRPEQAAESFTPFLPAGLGGVFVAMGLTFIAFQGYDLIATVAEEIKSPEKTIPRATFISLGVTMIFYLLILFISLGAINADGAPSWKFLGEHGETAIVRAAEDIMPAFGVAIIVFGGLLSTMSALNATVMAASRVAFSMGRDLLLPKRIADIHPVRRTPQVAIVTTGIILLVVALTLPLETVGSAASLMFLLTFSLVNLSVIVLRRKHPDIQRKYRVPFYPVIPLLGFVLNIFLALYQFNFQPIAWFVTVGWIIVGFLLYYAVFERKAAHLEPQVLQPVRADVEQQPSLIVALHNPDNIETLLRLAYPVARDQGLRLIAFSVVQVPRQMPIHEGIRFAHHREALLNRARKFATEKGILLETDLVVAHLASDGILAAIKRHKAAVLVMGWKGYANARDRIFGEIADHIIRQAPCDLMLLKVANGNDFKNCLLPSAGGPNAQFAASILNSVGKESPMTVTGGYVVSPDASDRERKKSLRLVRESLELSELSISSDPQLIEAASVAGGIARASRNYDLVAIGAAKEPWFKRMIFGKIPEKVARYSPTSVLVVKKHEGAIKSGLKRILG